VKFTSSVEYRILKTILNHNVKFHSPRLREILSEANFTTRNTIEVTIHSLKQRGLLKTIGTRKNYSYFLTEIGINTVKDFEDYEDRQLLLTLCKLQSYGD
jgi:transcriptional antiterminator